MTKIINNPISNSNMYQKPNINTTKLRIGKLDLLEIGVGYWELVIIDNL